MYRYFNLYSFCIPVKGIKRAVVCDLQRNIIQPIPLLLFEYLEKIKTVDEPLLMLDDYSKIQRNTINEYINFLYYNQFGYFTTNKPVISETIVPEYFDDSLITNAIVDFNRNSVHSLKNIVDQLSGLGCKAIEIRYFYPVPFTHLMDSLEIASNSSLEKIEFLLQKNEEINWSKILQLNNDYPKLKKVTLSNTADNIIYKHEDLVVIYTTEIIRNETKCGVTGELYCIADNRLFWESQNYNNCLYKKISIDKSGMIKNCPSMQDNFGHIDNTKLSEVILNENFKKYWTITKDSIEVCSECELRYVCQDCRAYTLNMNNPFSKPLKCRYNPKD
jgi:SPASM domain peptide maturase of grasp-with-spasm system